jgi:hypothetical protein
MSFNSTNLERGKTITAPVIPEHTEELAEVSYYDSEANSYTVVTRGIGGDVSQPGGRQLIGIPRKTQTVNSESPIPLGTLVVVNWTLGFPYIDGILAIENIPESQKKASISLGYAPRAKQTLNSATTNITPKVSNFQTPNTPSNLLPEDYVQTSPEGNFIGVLRNKLNIISGGDSTKARIEVVGDKDLLRLICEDLEVITGFGILEFYNEEGHCGIRLKGGTDQLNQTGGDEEQWTFKLDIGDSGDMFMLEVCSAEGATKAKVHISSDGKVDVIATNGLSLTNGGAAPVSIETASNLTTKTQGHYIQEIQRDVTSVVLGSYITTVSNQKQTTIGAHNALLVSGDQTSHTGGNYVATYVGGAFKDAKSSNIALHTDILNGSAFLELGNPLKGANPKAKASLTVAVNNGAITLGENPDIMAPPATQAHINLNTSKPRSIALGGTVGTSKNVASYNVAMYQPLLQVLQLMITIFDAHTHPGINVVTPTLMSSTITSLLSNIMSQRVLIGG